MQHLEISCAVRRSYKSLGVKGLFKNHSTIRRYKTSVVEKVVK